MQLETRTPPAVAHVAAALRAAPPLLDDAAFATDPNDEPARWESAGALRLCTVARTAVAHICGSAAARTNVIRVGGLADEPDPPPSPYRDTPDYSRLRSTLAGMFGVIGLIGAHAFAYATENGGRILRDVVAREDSGDEYSSHGWGRDLPWHMDAAFRPLDEEELVRVTGLSPAPRWLVFGVVYGDRDTPLTFASVDEAVLRLSERHVEALCRADFEARSPASCCAPRTTSGVAMLQRDAEGGYFSRFNALVCSATSAAGRAALAALAAELRDPALHHTVPLVAGDVVVLDNWRSLHTRPAYRPRWDGTDRWLIRVYAAPNGGPAIPASGEMLRTYA